MKTLIRSSSRLLSSARMMGMRYGTVLMALPLCSSVCFLGVRFLLAAMGITF
jgi:hypothetical protein